jgi:hypothetical protein
LHALFYRDADWWKRELVDLQEKTERAKDDFMKMAYCRIKAYIGVACHSVCVRYEKEKDVTKLGTTLDIYRLVESENTDIKRFEIVLSVLKRDVDKNLS